MMIVHITLHGSKPSANLLTIRVNPLDADPDHNSALQSKRIMVS